MFCYMSTEEEALFFFASFIGDRRDIGSKTAEKCSGTSKRSRNEGEELPEAAANVTPAVAKA